MGKIIECVAEMTTNHLGNLNLLLRMVDKAVEAGASAVKMQRKDVETFYTKEKLDREYDSPYGRTYRDYRTTFEFTHPDWQRFDKHCRRSGIPWFVTVQDFPSLEYMLEYDLYRYKVASANARNKPFLEEVARSVPMDREIVLSVAGSTLIEIEEALSIFNDHRRIWLLHCVAEYPCSSERLRLGNISVLRKHFACDQVRIGYSGHEVSYLPSLVAGRLGAEMIERHFCLSRHTFAHHIGCSLEPEEFAAMVQKLGEPNGEAPFPQTDYEKRLLFWHFGMSEEEKTFLVDNTYGTQELGEYSQF